MGGFGLHRPSDSVLLATSAPRQHTRLLAHTSLHLYQRTQCYYDGDSRCGRCLHGRCVAVGYGRFRERVDHGVGLLPPAVALAAVVLDDALDATPGLVMEARICYGLLDFVASKLDACHQAHGVGVVEGLRAGSR